MNDKRQPVNTFKIECPERAVIFDLDGVITDTAEYHYQAWRQLAEEEGFSFSRRDNEKLRGVSRRASLELILKGRSLPEAEMLELMERKNSYYREMIKSISPRDLLPGAINILEELKKRDIRLALASASKNARYVVSRLGIEGYFAVIADGFSVNNPKPAPDLFLFAAKSLGVPPQCAIVVEDAEAGITAAIKAGMATVGIGPPERVGRADLVCSTVEKIIIDEMLALIAKS